MEHLTETKFDTSFLYSIYLRIWSLYSWTEKKNSFFQMASY